MLSEDEMRLGRAVLPALGLFRQPSLANSGVAVLEICENVRYLVVSGVTCKHHATLRTGRSFLSTSHDTPGVEHSFRH